MTLNKTLIAALGLALAGAAVADTPNLNPGMWETTTKTTMTSPQFSMPAQTNTTSQCMTAEDLAKGEAFMQDSGQDCEFTNKDIRSDGMDFTMTCNTGGGKMTMNTSMKFHGDTMDGTVDGKMESAAGPMDMKVEMSGKRTGDC